jgi:hypothetical protein
MILTLHRKGKLSIVYIADAAKQLYKWLNLSTLGYEFKRNNTSKSERIFVTM